MTTTKLSDKMWWSYKQRNRLDKIIWPIAPDGYIPNSVVRNLAPFPKFPNFSGHYCVDNVEEDRTLILKKQLRRHFPPKEKQQNNEDHQGGSEDGLQSVPEGTTGYTRASLEPFHSDMAVNTKTGAKVTPLRRAIPQSQHSLNNRQMLLQQNVASKKTLQTNASSVEELQTKASSVEELQTNASSVEELQTNASSADELKNEEDVDFPHPPEIVPQSLSAESNAFPTKRANKGKKVSLNLPKGLSLSPMLQQEKVEVKQEIASSIKEPKKSIEKSRHVAEIGDPNQNMRQKTNFSLKKLKSCVSPLPPKCDKGPGSVLMFLYKRSKAESSPSDAVQKRFGPQLECSLHSKPGFCVDGTF